MSTQTPKDIAAKMVAIKGDKAQDWFDSYLKDLEPWQELHGYDLDQAVVRLQSELNKLKGLK